MQNFCNAILNISTTMFIPKKKMIGDKYILLLLDLH